MNDTIAAIATGMGSSGIGIIRISGDKAIEIADKIFEPKNNKKKISNMTSYTAAFGHITYNDEIYDVQHIVRSSLRYRSRAMDETFMPRSYHHRVGSEMCQYIYNKKRVRCIRCRRSGFK